MAGTIHDRRDFLGTFLWLVVWGGAQQWVLQTTVLRDCQRATNRHAGIGIAALLFGLLHMPNVFLAVMTTIGALIWCGIYDRYPNIVPLAVSHTPLTTMAILYTFDEAITGRLRIGASFLRLTAPRAPFNTVALQPGLRAPRVRTMAARWTQRPWKKRRVTALFR